jgi:phage gp29-like protein
MGTPVALATYRPPVRVAKSIPVVSWTDWDNVQSVKTAIRQLEYGVFDSSSQIVDAMGRDDRLSGCLMTRSEALPSLPLTLEPRGDGRQRKAVAREVEESFDSMFPNYALSELLGWGVMEGIGLGQLLWTYSLKRWTPRLKVWHPKHVSYRHQEDAYYVGTADGQTRVTPGDGQWVLFTPYGPDRAWMRGKVRCLYTSWLIRQWAMRDWARYSEVHGNPVKKAKTPAGMEDAQAKRFLEEVANLGNEATIRIPTLQEGLAAFDLELLEAAANTWEGFYRLIGETNNNISIALLGQNLTTEVKDRGSYAAERGHDKVKTELLHADGERLGQCIREQCLKPWTARNFGDPELAPMPKWKTKSADPALGTAMKSLGEGATALQAAGGRPDLDKIMEDNDIPALGPADEPEDLEGEADEDEGPGEVVEDEEQATPAAASQVALASGGPPIPAAAIEGQLYVDDLAEQSARAATKLMAPTLESILRLIDQADDFQALKAGILKTYGKMSRKRLAKLMQHAMMMAELAGRAAVLEEPLEELEGDE